MIYAISERARAAPLLPVTLREFVTRAAGYAFVSLSTSVFSGMQLHLALCYSTRAVVREAARGGHNDVVDMLLHSLSAASLATWNVPVAIVWGIVDATSDVVFTAVFERLVDAMFRHSTLPRTQLAYRMTLWVTHFATTLITSPLVAVATRFQAATLLRDVLVNDDGTSAPHPFVADGSGYNDSPALVQAHIAAGTAPAASAAQPSDADAPALGDDADADADDSADADAAGGDAPAVSVGVDVDAAAAAAAAASPVVARRPARRRLGSAELAGVVLATVVADVRLLATARTLFAVALVVPTVLYAAAIGLRPPGAVPRMGASQSQIVSRLHAHASVSTRPVIAGFDITRIVLGQSGLKDLLRLGTPLYCGDQRGGVMRGSVGAVARAAHGFVSLLFGSLEQAGRDVFTIVNPVPHAAALARGVRHAAVRVHRALWYDAPRRVRAWVGR